jgi:hypothetical protein
MRGRARSGQSIRAEAEALIRPGPRLGAFERLEIYSRQYWLRVTASLEEDFPGLRSIVGRRRFDAILVAYLLDCPSTSFTLRDLGARLSGWLERHPERTAPGTRAAVQMALLEWAHIEAFDGAEWPRLTAGEMAAVGEDSLLSLQPCLRLLEADFAVDDALLRVRGEQRGEGAGSNHASRPRGRRPVRPASLPAGERVFLAVHRQDNSVYYRRLPGEDYRLLGALGEGRPLGEAIDAAFAASSIPAAQQPAHLESAFRLWSSLGWLCRRPEEEEGA